jgi:hypothetical protein
LATEHIYLPNEVFTDLKLHIPNGSQTAFAYSYLYYITYLYRYCKYISDNGDKVTQEAIKEVLGYSPKNKKVDYIIKKGGVLDNLMYSETTTDYPIQYFYDDDDLLTFETISNYKGIIKNLNDRNFKIKKPLRAFHRSLKAIEDKELSGTFYEVENTHRIDFRVFLTIIMNGDLGTAGFYLYGYLKHKNDIFKSGYQRSYEKLGFDTGFSEKTVRKYVNLLEFNNLISVERKLFDIKLSQEDYEANIYNVV